MTDLFNKAEDVVIWIITATLGAVATGVSWLVRRVFTNQQEIALLKADLEHRTKQRNEDRDRMTRIEGGIEAIQSVLMSGKDAS